MLIRSSLYNLLGLGLPLVVAIGAMPVLIHDLGDARFGILTLIWAVVSYFGLFDLGLGRALTQQLSVCLAQQREKEIPALVGTGLWLLTGLGIVAGLLMWFGASAGANMIAYAGDKSEIIDSVRVVAWGMPFILLTSGLRGMLEAKFAFGIINMIRLPMGTFTFIGPLAVVLWYKNDLVAITWALTWGRVVACLIHAYYAARILPGFYRGKSFSLAWAKALLISGGWMAVSNMLSPLMSYLDRFVIGVSISAAAVAYYVTPYEMLTKIWIIPNAISTVLFPKFSANADQNRTESTQLFTQSMVVLFFILYPITLFCGLFAKEILQIWINPAFAEKGFAVMQIFSLGMLVNCFWHVPYALIQAVGRSKITATIHLSMVIPYVIVLWMLTSYLGLLGAALAWLIKMAIETAIMFRQAEKIVFGSSQKNRQSKLIVLGIFVVASFLGAYLSDWFVKAGLFFSAYSGVCVYYWYCLASNEQRTWVREKIRVKSTKLF